MLELKRTLTLEEFPHALTPPNQLTPRIPEKHEVVHIPHLARHRRQRVGSLVPKAPDSRPERASLGSPADSPRPKAGSGGPT
jgi:hypothetical protein